MGQRTITTHPVLSAIRIEPTAADPRVIVEGQVQDDQGRVIEAVAKDIYPDLTAQQRSRVGDIISFGTNVVRQAAGD